MEKGTSDKGLESQKEADVGKLGGKGEIRGWGR
jgi:hypothetical protein